jgi:nucleolar protein 58
MMQLVSFQAFSDTAEAVVAATACMEGTVCRTLKSFLRKKLKKQSSMSLAVADKNMAVSLKDAGVSSSLVVVHDQKTNELFRGLRFHMDHLLSNNNNSTASLGVSGADLRAMQLGLSHSLGRYKLKFSADKVDTMVIQAVGLLDELDKEINTYAMRTKEWYGWHFPELQMLVPDNKHYAQLVLLCGMRTAYANMDLSSVLEDEGTVAAVKEAAEISMGTEIAELDIVNISSLADQVLSLTEYRLQLFEYLKNRMNAIAPNLTILVGELVGARLISHAGSLMNLAKQPASTVQILGAEKALFRALKTKSDTPKYGLIYHASLIGQAAPKNKGKISRVLAAKASLAIRVDALSDDAVDGGGVDTTIGFEGRAKVEARLRQLEGSGGAAFVRSNTASTTTGQYNAVAARSAATGTTYQNASDMQDVAVAHVNGNDTPNKKKDKKESKKDKKRKASFTGDEEEEGDKSSKKKKKKKDKGDNDGEDNNDVKNEDDDDDKRESAKKKSAKKVKKEKRKSS